MGDRSALHLSQVPSAAVRRLWWGWASAQAEDDTCLDAQNQLVAILS